MGFDIEIKVKQNPTQQRCSGVWDWPLHMIRLQFRSIEVVSHSVIFVYVIVIFYHDGPVCRAQGSRSQGKATGEKRSFRISVFVPHVETGAETAGAECTLKVRSRSVVTVVDDRKLV